jgi:inorganic pyrophosphatase
VEFEVVVEIQKGSRIKYVVDHVSGKLKLYR